MKNRINSPADPDQGPFVIELNINEQFRSYWEATYGKDAPHSGEQRDQVHQAFLAGAMGSCIELQKLAMVGDSEKEIQMGAEGFEAFQNSIILASRALTAKAEERRKREKDSN